MTAALEITDLQAWYGESHILHGISLSVAPGEVVTLLGRNGAGRTTTLRAVMGLTGLRGAGASEPLRSVTVAPGQTLSQIALAELRFEGVRGADPTPERRLAVAAGAALLLHGRPDWDLPTGRTILFYPDRFDDQYDLDDDASADELEQAAKQVAEENGVGLGKLAAPLRAALAGRTATPSVFDMMTALGREESLARLQDQTDLAG